MNFASCLKIGVHYSLQYSTDNCNTWNSYTIGQTIALSSGSKVYFKATTANNTFSTGYYNNYYKFGMTGSVSAAGNIMSLLDTTLQQTSVPYYAFNHLFAGCSTLTKSPELPATSLTYYCYYLMFEGCTSLTQAPELPATTLGRYASNCYNKMFKGCTSLTQAPDLPATSLASYCYSYMFDGCTALLQAPALPATTLANNCYEYMFNNCSSLANTSAISATTLADQCCQYMFNNCSSLVQAPALLATTLAYQCYYGMFKGCTSLTQAQTLPATTLYNLCYSSMFEGCTSLAQAPILSATTLAENCCLRMFYGCTALTQAPALPATSLANYCYQQMFSGCTALTQAPTLPANTLSNNCYNQMFYECTSLTQAPALPATTLADGCYNFMFYGCTSLTQAPALPATTLVSSCYGSMFEGCTSLTHAPNLPATSLASYCYSRMFNGCTSLSEVPSLPATTLASGCYYFMFYGCQAIKLNSSGPGKLWKIPSNADASQASNWNSLMFTNTGGTFTGEPVIGTDYYMQVPVNVVVLSNDSSKGNVSGSGTYNYGQSVTITATPTNGNCFVKWSNGQTTPSITMTVNSDTTLTAIFAAPDTVDYLCFTAKNGSVTVKFYIKNVTHTIQYSTDKKNWNTYNSLTPINLNAEEKVYFRAENNQTTATAFGGGWQFNSSMFSFTSSNGGTIEGSGNIMSLYGPDCPNLQLTQDAFTYMFYNSDLLTQAPSLPATNLANSCYAHMFYNCTSLTQAPSLPATTLADYCYLGMFFGCTSLTQAPSLPAISLAKECYADMFCGCTSLTQVPSLSATTLADSCCQGMFQWCTSLTQAPSLPATTLADYCYARMFYNCTSLTQAPSLPATTLANNCYAEMFFNCTSLTQAPSLPATTLANNCYAEMFFNCTSLTQAPSLPASTLADYCYARMFCNCTSLTQATSLPATTLADYCYWVMFGNCKSLTQAPSLPATTLTDYCYSSMFYNCKSLTQAPSLPATALDNSCYAEMFSNCTSLTDAPSLPATALDNSCYAGMFQNCTSLIQAPSLPATALTDSCYSFMFKECSSLTQIPNLPATSLADYCYYEMFDGCTSLVVNAYGPGKKWGIPNNATSANNWNLYMLDRTSGTFHNGPVIGQIYYIASGPMSVTVTANDSSMGSVTGGGTFDYGTTTTLTAIPNTHYHLVSWSNGSTNSSITISVVGDTTLTANFAIDQHTITANPNDSTMGIVTGGGSYNYGQTITLTASPNAHHHFISWSNGKSDLTITVPVYGDSTLTATFAIDQHIVTVNSNDETMGSVTGGGTFDYGQTVTLTATANEHYHFVSWSNGQTTPTINVTVNGDSTLTATFAIDQHTVTVNSNDETMGSVTGGGTFDYGQTATLSATANEHYHFVSWSNGLTTPTITITVGGDTTLTASFAIDQHTVTVSSNDQTMGSVTGGGTFDYGQTATLSAIANEHYHFVSWSNGQTASTITITVNGDTTLTATFAIDQHTVTVNSNDATMGSVTGGGTFDYGQTVTLTATANEHYHFVSWSNGQTSPTITVTVGGDTTLTATFAIDQHTVTVSSNDETMGSVTGGGTFDYGQTVTLNATANEHYHFVSWSNGLTTPTITITVSGDTTLTATFAIDQHTVTVNSNDETMGSVTGGGTFDYGQTVTLSATANEHYHFVSWSNGLTSTTVNVTVGGDTTLTASFAIDQHTVTVNSNDETMGSVTGGGTFDYGQTATLSATANEHYHFVSWSNGLTSTTINVTVGGDTTLTATFAIDQHTVTVNSNDETMGSVTGGGTFDYGQTVTLTATANEHYHFVSWSNGQTASTINVTVGGDSTLTAIFAINQHTVTVSSNDATMGSVTGGGTFDYGQTVTLSATANEHYHFVSWSNGQTTTTINVTVNGDSTLTATFAIDQHTVTVSSNDETMGSVNGGGTFDYGQTVTLTATANEHYHFVSWSNGLTSTAINITVGGDTTLTATFAIDQHTVTVSSNDETMGGVTGGGTFDYGQTATLTATANEHYHFVSWSNGQTASTINVTVSGDTTLTATFEADVYNVTATANYASRGTVTGSGQYSYLDRATLTAMPNEGYIFSGWSNGESNQTIYITVECDTAVTAIFEEETTAVDDVEESRDIIIAPNPVKVGETICIKGDFTDEEMYGMVVEILSTDGAVVGRTSVSNNPIEIEGINAVGTYIVRITTGTGKVYVEKLMVK